jgi:uncharacterized membrane protein YoaK (UPF0700 family)
MSGTIDARSQRKPTAYSLRLGVLLAVAGGFLDAFTFVGHHGVFANAQTGNVVLLGISAATGQWFAALQHVPPLIAFVLGVATAETLTRPRVAAVVRRPVRAALVAEIIVLLVVGAMPDNFADIGVVVVVAFVAAVQSTTFPTLRRWSFSTVMTTGNLRTATRAAYRALLDRQSGAAEQARSFAVVCLAFLLGAALGAPTTQLWHNTAAWIPAALLAAGLLLFSLDEAHEQRSRFRWRTPLSLGHIARKRR